MGKVCGSGGTGAVLRILARGVKVGTPDADIHCAVFDNLRGSRGCFQAASLDAAGIESGFAGWSLRNPPAPKWRVPKPPPTLQNNSRFLVGGTDAKPFPGTGPTDCLVIRLGAAPATGRWRRQ